MVLPHTTIMGELTNDLTQIDDPKAFFYRVALLYVNHALYDLKCVDAPLNKPI